MKGPIPNRSVMSAIDKVVSILEKKGRLYGDSFSENRRRYGMVAPLIRIEEKVSRLRNIFQNGDALESESWEDTLLDIIGYCILEIAYLEDCRGQ